MVMLFSIKATSAASETPVLVGISAEYGMQGSHAAQSIEAGVRLAIAEINAAGGVLGRRMDILTRDDRGVPARGVTNLRDFAANPDILAILTGRFSPVVQETAPLASQLGVILIDPWAAADDITRIGPRPSYVFRVSLTDTHAINKMLSHAMRRGLEHVALVLPNTGWGRSCQAAAEQFSKQHPRLRFDIHWYNWGDREFAPMLREARKQDAKAVVMVANESEGGLIVKEIASWPRAERLPIISHWGITAGDFRAAVGDALDNVDLRVVQTFTLQGKQSLKAHAVADSYARHFQADARQMHAIVGFAHGYDATYMLARAIVRAGRFDRASVRTSLERLGAYDGLVRAWRRPFTPESHEAFDATEVYLARYNNMGFLERAD
jgi:branched-chain amino acid transport system substrate-binding protein